MQSCAVPKTKKPGARIIYETVSQASGKLRNHSARKKSSVQRPLSHNRGPRGLRLTLGALTLVRGSQLMLGA